MTSRTQASRQRTVSVRYGLTRTSGAGTLAACLLILQQLATPAPAAAQWGKLEKLSGPGPFTGVVGEFRVACFGPDDTRIPDAENATTDAADEMKRQGQISPMNRDWGKAALEWRNAASKWADIVGPSQPARSTSLSSAPASQQDAEREEEQARALRRQAYSGAAALNVAGAFWSFCSPTKVRRVGLDVGMHVLRARGREEYAGGAPIELTTLMTSLSWRVLANTNADFLEFSTGGGAYWFTSSGFPSKSGVVLEPVRFTLRAPTQWSRAPVSHVKRLAAVPSFAVGWTMFPAGFEPDDFNATGDKAVRLTREFVPTIYVLLNVQPLLQLLHR